MGRGNRLKNKIKREDAYHKIKKQKTQERLKKRLDRAQEEKLDPKKRKERLEKNIPRTLDNTREYDPSMLITNIAHPVASSSTPNDISSPNQPTREPDEEAMYDISTDPFSSYFSPPETTDGSPPAPKVLITTCQRATKVSYEFCEEIVDVFPGAEFIRRKKGQGFEIGRISGWAGKRGYTHLMVVNEDRKSPNAITLVYLPSGPTTYFKLTSIQLTKDIYGHARATPHAPELVLNNFVTRLGHTVGRMFQTLFPPLPEFQGRQVVTLHNQRDFLFFRRHRYAFRGAEKTDLQEIGPRFTLKLRWLKKGIPGVGSAFGSGGPSLPLEVDVKGMSTENNEDVASQAGIQEGGAKVPEAAKGGMDEYEWMWKPQLETTRRTFFL